MFFPSIHLCLLPFLQPHPLGLQRAFSLMHKTRSAHFFWVFSLPCVWLPGAPGGSRLSCRLTQGCCPIGINMAGAGTAGSSLLPSFSFFFLPFSSQSTMQAQVICFLNSIWHSPVRTWLLALARLSTKIISTQNRERWEKGYQMWSLGERLPTKTLAQNGVIQLQSHGPETNEQLPQGWHRFQRVFQCNAGQGS